MMILRGWAVLLAGWLVFFSDIVLAAPPDPLLFEI